MEAQRSWIARGVVSRMLGFLGLSAVMFDRLDDSEFSNNHYLYERDTPFIRPGLDFCDPTTPGVIAPKFALAYLPFGDDQYVTVSTLTVKPLYQDWLLQAQPWQPRNERT